MAQLLLTDWLTICTAGPTVDGRTIEEKWLTEAAKNYDREEYPAFYGQHKAESRHASGVARIEGKGI